MTISASFRSSDTHVFVEAPDAARSLLRTITAPAHHPGIGLVARNTLACLAALLTEVHYARSPLTEIISQLEKLADDLGDCTAHPHAVLGLASEYPAWAWFTAASFPSEPRLKTLIGKHLAVAILKGEPIRKRVVTELRRLISKRREESLTEKELEVALTKLEGLAHRKLHQLLDLYTGFATRAQLSFNAAVKSTLSNRLSSLRKTERQAVDAGQTLSRSELIRTVAYLRDQAQEGHPDDLVTLICLCLGLGLDLGKQTPLIASQEQQGAMAWIDPLMGCMYVDLSFTLADLGKRTSPRHQTSTLLLKRPLPLCLANMLQGALARNPQLRTLGDLCIHKASSRKKLDLPAAHHSASLARLMNSTRPVSLQTTGRRDISAYAALAFELVNKSDLHYLCPRESEIWQACSDLYETVGLGSAIPRQLNDANKIRVGSRLTPSADWIKEVFACAADELHAHRCGRRYSLQSLVKQHNAFVGYVGLFMQFALGGRDRRIIEFRANNWTVATAFGVMEDKPMSATRGRTPIPISAALAQQIRLWHAHITALSKRLTKLKAFGSLAALQLIEQITAFKDVPMLFVLDQHGTPAHLTSAVLFTDKTHGLNHDFGRHLLPDLLMDAGVVFEDIQDWLRHYTPGCSTHELHSHRVMHQINERLSASIDQVLLDLDIRPRAGLTKEISQ